MASQLLFYMTLVEELEYVFIGKMPVLDINVVSILQCNVCVILIPVAPSGAYGIREKLFHFSFSFLQTAGRTSWSPSQDRYLHRVT
jgi:hypothetical protein